MKQRLLVMNGQKIVQHEQEGRWLNDKVEKAGLVKPGIYNLYLARQADKTKTHDGLILHVDIDNVFQQVGTNVVLHERVDFAKVPTVGVYTSITYDQGRATASAVSYTLSRGVSR
jgi:hypothetical protein